MLKIVGIECGFPIRIEKNAPEKKRIDELEKTQHYTYFASDLLKAKDLGVDMIRYGVPWHRVEKKQGQFDWSWMDGTLDLIRALNIEPIVDMCHFGTPDWLAEEGGFASPDFASCLSNYIQAFAKRYKHIKYYTPVNEPLITTRFCGRYGDWHPFRRDAFELISENIINGIIKSVNELRRTNSAVMIMQNDNCEHHTAGCPCDNCQQTAQRLNEERFYIWDRTKDHFDIMGLDYYPWTEETHYCGHKTYHSYRGLYDLTKEYYARYQKPLIVAETDHADLEGSVENRLLWMETTLSHCHQLIAEAIPMLGYTWWPLIDNLDWANFSNDGLPDNAGLYSLVKNEDGQWLREATPLVERFRRPF